MKRKLLKTAASMLTVCSIMLSAAACGTQNEQPDDTPAITPTTAPTATPPASQTSTPAVTDDDDASIYETVLSSVPDSWNPHTWLSAIDMVMLEYVTTPIVANVPNEDGTISFVNKAATEITDITADFEDKEKWGIDEDAEENFVFQIDLNPSMKWEDGTDINADTYIESLKILFDPAMSNYRAGRYSVGAEAIRGAFKYVNKDKAGEDIYTNAIEVETDEDTVYYLNPDANCYFFNNNSMAYYYNSPYKPFFFTDDGVDLYEKYAEEGGFFEVTDEIIEELTALAAGFGDNNPDAWIEFCHVITGVYEEASWEDVGLIKTDEYQLVLITENPMTMDKFLTLMKRNWIVNEKAYEADATTTDGVTSTTYNTADGTTVSYGPYKLVSFEVGKEIILEKNENWFGWEDGEHDGIYTYEEFGDYDIVRIILPEIAEEEEEKEDTKTTTSSEAGETHAFPFAFETEDIFGNTVTAEDIGEKEIFFVHLWATWCGPCVSEMAELADIANMFGDSVGFIGLLDDFDSNAKGAAKLAEYHNIPFINIYSRLPELDELLQMLKSGYIPTTILIDGEGNIIGEQIVGSYGLEYGDFIEAALEAVRK